MALYEELSIEQKAKQLDMMITPYTYRVAEMLKEPTEKVGLPGGYRNGLSHGQPFERVSGNAEQ